MRLAMTTGIEMPVSAEHPPYEAETSSESLLGYAALYPTYETI